MRDPTRPLRPAGPLRPARSMVPIPALVLLSGLIPLSTLACGDGPDAAREAADSVGAPAADATGGADGGDDGAPPPLRVAVTIDDVPWSGRAWNGLDRAAETRRFLAHLTERDIPFAALITCGNRPPDGPLLPLWLDAGPPSSTPSAPRTPR